MVNTELGVVFLQDHRLRTDTLFIRAQSMIRADGFCPRKFATLQRLRTWFSSPRIIGAAKE